MSPAWGSSPSAQSLREQKLYSVVSVPLGVTLKSVPQPFTQAAGLLVPPQTVVPYKSPLIAWTSPAPGPDPSVQPLWEQKLYRVVSAPLGVILKTVPAPLAPPSYVVP